MPSSLRPALLLASAGPRLVAAAALLPAWLVLALAACHRELPPVAPGEPIPAAPELVLGTMDAECDGLIAALATFKTCPNLDDDDRWDIDAWSERAQQDFAAGKKANPEPNAQRAIAAACHKATASVAAATERCNAGPKPPR
ncbi:MAG TPA: hypothetical protein VFK02_20700 [Kofleriaceae bacterium]|nr:hypothetical protein [Kofleriaceae bacterium]